MIRVISSAAFAGLFAGVEPSRAVWDEIREKEFPNRVFSDLAGVTNQLKLSRSANDVIQDLKDIARIARHGSVQIWNVVP